MKWRMHENSLFAVLLRSPWWVSLLLTLAIFAGLRLVIPWYYAAFGTLPIFIIGLVAAWRQLRAPSAENIATALDALRGMNWDAFSNLLEEGFRRDGYAVERLGGAQADFELTKAGRKSLVACKRWKAARTGVEPLRELRAAGEAREAAECLYVLAGDLSEQARGFAMQNRIRLVEGPELAQLARKG
ncbi:MAG: restriction endonuclease [Betaproteobacteria bacterium]|nr:restriction endonuclease [Betaproteobacteria bacterium]